MAKRVALVAFCALLMLTGVAQAKHKPPKDKPDKPPKNYPAKSSIEVRDRNGNLIGESGVIVGEALTVFSSGWASRAQVRGTWFSDPIDLGSHPTNDDGESTFTFNVPNAPPVPGVHTLRLEGTGADDHARRIDVAIKVKPRPGGTGDTERGGGAGDISRGGGTGSNVLGTNISRGSAFAKTGGFLANFAYVGFALLMMGVALYVGVRKRGVVTR